MMMDDLVEQRLVMALAMVVVVSEYGSGVVSADGDDSGGDGGGSGDVGTSWGGGYLRWI